MWAALPAAHHHQLYARWMQIGAFNPYMRNHSGINSKASEPWAYGEEVLEITRNYINLRYRLLPYLYSSFYEATKPAALLCARLLLIIHMMKMCTTALV
jgi:alpha-glucosidase